MKVKELLILGTISLIVAVISLGWLIAMSFVNAEVLTVETFSLNISHYASKMDLRGLFFVLGSYGVALPALIGLVILSHFNLLTKFPEVNQGLNVAITAGLFFLCLTVFIVIKRRFFNRK